MSSRDNKNIVCNLARYPNLYISATDNANDIEHIKCYVKTDVVTAIEKKRILRGDISSELESMSVYRFIESGFGSIRLTLCF